MTIDLDALEAAALAAAASSDADDEDTLWVTAAERTFHVDHATPAAVVELVAELRAARECVYALGKLEGYASGRENEGDPWPLEIRDARAAMRAYVDVIRRQQEAGR